MAVKPLKRKEGNFTVPHACNLLINLYALRQLSVVCQVPAGEFNSRDLILVYLTAKAFVHTFTTCCALVTLCHCAELVHSDNMPSDQPSCQE